MNSSRDLSPSASDLEVATSHTWEVVGDEVAQAVGTALEPVLERARDNLYGALLDTVQDYLSENLAFNIASRIGAAEREARQLRGLNAELLAALRVALHALVATENLRATDLTQEIFDAHLGNGVPRDQLEWVIDHTAEIACIEAAIDKATGQ